MTSQARSKIVIIGAGGHAKVVTDCIRDADRFEILGYLDSNPHSSFDLSSILGDDTLIPDLIKNGISTFVVAIGNNEVRKEIAASLTPMGCSLPVIIHPSAYISRDTDLGAGTVIMPGVVITANVYVGIGCIINTRAGIDHDCVIEAFAHVGPGSTLAGNVKIGNSTFIGAGATVIPGISIGENCVIGAGSVVVRNLVGGTKSFGVPAKVVQSFGRGE